MRRQVGVSTISDMAISAREAADARFATNEDGYDATQVDSYVLRVAQTLAAQERELTETRAEIGRLEHALDLAHVAQSSVAAVETGPSGSALGAALWTAGADQAEIAGPKAPLAPDPTSDPVTVVELWSEDLAADHASRLELLVTQEEVRRLRGTANALATEAAVARHGTREGLSPTEQEAAEAEALSILETAEAEAADLLEASLAEAQQVIAGAEVAALAVTSTAAAEVKELTQRTAQLRTALRDAGQRFEQLAADTRTEIRMLEDFIDLEMERDEASSRPDDGGEATTIDLRSGVDPSTLEPATSDEPESSPGFYERRLAGLRERLENT
jgi:cell division septum initiation protein DivIVA